jgi:hypothetical protein
VKNLPSRIPAAAVAAALGALVALATPGHAADAPAGSHGIVTMTRGMKVFGDAETELIAALKAQDAAALDRLVGPDFEQRTQGAPGTPVPREDWLKQASTELAKATGVREMAVHDFGDIAIVSFVLVRDAPQASAFVVDVWQRKSAGEAGQLQTRYLSAAPASAPRKRPAVPAAGSSPVDPKR